METRPFGSTGERVSALGFGAAPLGGEYGDLDESVGVAAVHRALDLGVTYFDTAPYYGRTLSEERLGRALEGRRDEVFLATKCCRDGARRFDFSARRVRESIDASLERLRTDRVDLLQVHDVEFGDVRQILDETLPALAAIRDAGKARYVGITGYPLPVLGEIARAFPVDAVLSYCHLDLLVRDLARDLLPWGEANGVAVVNASTLHMGLLTPGDDPPWHPAPDAVRAAAREVVRLCEEAGRDVVEVALRHALDETRVATTLVGMATVDEVERNARVLDAASDPALLAAIEAAVEPARDVAWPSGNWSPSPPSS